jgi:hypothetical protein
MDFVRKEGRSFAAALTMYNEKGASSESCIAQQRSGRTLVSGRHGRVTHEGEVVSPPFSALPSAARNFSRLKQQHPPAEAASAADLRRVAAEVEQVKQTLAGLTRSVTDLVSALPSGLPPPHAVPFDQHPNMVRFREPQ